jgi:branched-chain amino acid transport system ATP-binding protein
VLDVRDLRVRYGEMEALRGISFHVAAGEAVALIGANGAGKSTTLRAIMGLAEATGEIRFEGRPLDPLAPWQRARLGIGWVPEGRRVFGNFTVEENLLAGAYPRRDREAARRDLERVYALFPRLGERRRQVARTLSGGEQQMLALGRALLGRPRLLLVDEASQGLAPLVAERLFEAIAELRRQGLTLLVVEQHARRALALAGRAYVLEVGRIVRAGSAAELRDDPAVRSAYLGA